MTEGPAPTTVVLALGNLIRSDDAVGLFALRRLQVDSRVPPSVSLVEGGTKGLELVPYVSDTSRLLVLDAVEVGALAGTVLRITGDELQALPSGSSVHDFALADILNALRLVGTEPQETVLIGVQPATTELGTSLSPPVQAALPALVEAVLSELSSWTSSSPSHSPAATERAKNGFGP